MRANGSVDPSIQRRVSFRHFRLPLTALAGFFTPSLPLCKNPPWRHEGGTEFGFPAPGDPVFSGNAISH
jgi:hypothetical protein